MKLIKDYENMNLIDAVKSGKAIRRRGVEYYMYPQTRGFDKEDILAEDWELEDEKISLSWDEIERAVLSGIRFRKPEMVVSVDTEIMKKELGFKE